MPMPTFIELVNDANNNVADMLRVLDAKQVDNDDLVTFGNDIRGNAALTNEVNSRNYDAIAGWYNDAANTPGWYSNPTPAQDRWGIRSQVAVQEITAVLDWQDDFDFTLETDSVVLQKETIKQLQALQLYQSQTYWPGPAGSRDALEVIYSGKSGTRAAILALINRKTTPAETLFAVTATGPGGGDGSQQTRAANFGVVEGPVSARTVERALAATG